MKVLIAFLVIFSSLAQVKLPVVAVGQAELEKDNFSFLTFVEGGFAPNEQKTVNEFQQLLINNFSFYKQTFLVVNPPIKDSSYGSTNYEAWSTRSIRYLVHVNYRKRSGIGYQVRLFDTQKKELAFEADGFFDPSNIRAKGHALADQIYQKITGKKSIFESKIIFVSDRGSTKRNPFKELYVMDFDGRNIRQLTRHRGTVISPAFSMDGKQVLYSLIRSKRKKRNINLYLLDIASGKSRLLSKRPGINSGAVFMPGGKKIALTLSHQGNAEIYTMDLGTGKLVRLTKHFSPDVDPSINVSGDRMAFLSGRPGKPMIYVSDPRGLEKSVKRVSFVGQFNATPRFSPDGKEIAFSSWMDNRFDIFRIDANGDQLYRLTKDFGSNEDPTYSNDGQFIAFSSQRVLSRTKAVQNIYIMTREGEIIGQVTSKFGNCITPRWSKL